MTKQPTARSATPLATDAWDGRVVVVSPHLDDAVLSLASSIHRATRRGVRVDVLTVLAGDPGSSTPADESGRRAGFTTAAQATAVRRAEDGRACRLIGAEPLWLPLSDVAGEKPDAQVIRDGLHVTLRDYDAVLIPGAPLAHADHLTVSQAVIDLLDAGAAVGLYVEQPYASWDAFALHGRSKRGTSPVLTTQALGLAVEGEPAMRRCPGDPQDWLAKTRAMSAYASQLRVLRRGPRTRILAYEILHRGEGVCWLRLA